MKTRALRTLAGLLANSTLAIHVPTNAARVLSSVFPCPGYVKPPTDEHESRADHPSPAVGQFGLACHAWTVFVFGSDGWVSPAGPVPNARSTFSVIALTIGLNGEPGPGGVSLVSHQIDPEANTPAPLGAV